MPRRAPIRLAPTLALGVLAGALGPTSGCGRSGDGKSADASPEFLKKNEDMLIKMQKDMQTKYQNKARGK